MACVVQDWRSGEVLTLAYMNAEALRLTRETGEVHFFSRARQELWHKGETSGNTLAVRSIRYDCDGDALLALVEPAGPACHTGERTCFHRGELEPRAPYESLPELERTIAERARTRPEDSYTAGLLADPELVRAKVQEEAEEVARASREETDERVAEEAADVIYHLAVLLRERGLALADAERVLDGRRPLGRRGHGRTDPVARGGPAARRDYNLIPIRETVIDDWRRPSRRSSSCGRARPGSCSSRPTRVGVGRYSFIGFRPLKVLRWSLGDPGDPYALAAEELARFRPAPLEGLPPFAGGAVGVFALRPGADRRAARRAQPGPDRDPRPGADADRRARRLRPPQAHHHRARQRACRRGSRRLLRAGAADDRRGPRGARGPGAAPARRQPAQRDGAGVRARTCRGSSSRRWSRGSSSTSTPATPFRWCPRSAGRRRSRWRRSRSTAGCGRSTRVPYMYFLDFGDFEIAGASPEPLITVTGAACRRGRSPARGRAERPPTRTDGSPRSCSPTRRSGPST